MTRAEFNATVQRDIDAMVKAAKPRRSDLLDCPECDGEGGYEVEVHGGPTAREDPDTHMQRCERCDGRGIATCRGCGDDLRATCPESCEWCRNCVDDAPDGAVVEA